MHDDFDKVKTDHNVTQKKFLKITLSILTLSLTGLLLGKFALALPLIIPVSGILFALSLCSSGLQTYSLHASNYNDTKNEEWDKVKGTLENLAKKREVFKEADVNDTLLNEVRAEAKQHNVEMQGLKQVITEQQKSISSQRAEVQGLKQVINASSETNKTLLECVVSIKNQMDQQSEKLAWLETQLMQRAIPAK